MKKRVIKFGGSNLKSKEDIAKLIKVVDCYKEPLVIVVSALYGVTDILVGALETVCSDEKAIPVLRKDLIDAHKKIIDLYIDDLQYRQNVLETISQRAGQLAKYLLGSHYIGEVPEFVADKVLSYGERLSSLTLEAILNFKNIRCRERLPEDLGLFTDGRFGCATVDFQISEKSVCEKLKGDETFIVPGFYGISPDSRVTLLGRGGSDYSAAAIARCIHASSVDLWKDVKGFMSADPKLVEHTVVVDTLSYNEAAELSYFGARILHPRTFEPAMEKSIPIRLFNIDDFSPSLEPLTVIEVEEVVADDVVKSVTFSDDFGILKLEGPEVGIEPGILAAVTSALKNAGINIKSVITAQTCINILLSRSVLEESLQLVRGLAIPAVDSVRGLGDISLIAVVGHGMLKRPGIAGRVFGAVSSCNINVVMISAGASNAAIYFFVHRNDRTRAVECIHKEFFA